MTLKENKQDSIERTLQKLNQEIRTHVQTEHELIKAAKATETELTNLRAAHSKVMGHYEQILDKLSSVHYQNDHLLQENQRLRALLDDPLISRQLARKNQLPPPPERSEKLDPRPPTNEREDPSRKRSSRSNSLWLLSEYPNKSALERRTHSKKGALIRLQRKSA